MPVPTSNLSISRSQEKCNGTPNNNERSSPGDRPEIFISNHTIDLLFFYESRPSQNAPTSNEPSINSIKK
jgi:hypothetical protein